MKRHQAEVEESREQRKDETEFIVILEFENKGRHPHPLKLSEATEKSFGAVKKC